MSTATEAQQVWEVLGEVAQLRNPKFTGWKASQEDAFHHWTDQNLNRLLIHYPTGEGKSMLALALLRSRGYTKVQVIAPLKTHDKWVSDASMFGMAIRVETPEKFRQAETVYSKSTPFVFDEFHKLGGHGGVGWKKLNKYAPLITAPLICLSATPNYNDAERCFCLQAILDDRPQRDYGTWLFDNCNTVPNRFAYYPDVDKDRPFKMYKGAVEYLADQPWCVYVPDTAEWDEETLDWSGAVGYDTLFERYNVSRRHMRVVNSDMEKRHKRVSLSLIDDNGYLEAGVAIQMLKVFREAKRNKWLVYCHHVDVADAVARTFSNTALVGKWTVAQIDGRTVDYDQQRKKFVEATGPSLLIGTSAIAEGVDGLDKVCQSLLFLDDIVGDDAKRRQVIGRILSRGTDDGIQRIVRRVTY